MATHNDNFMDLDWDFLDGDSSSSGNSHSTSNYAQNSNGYSQSTENVAPNSSRSASNSRATSYNNQSSRTNNQPSSNKGNQGAIYNPRIDNIDDYWKYYLDKIELITALEPEEYNSFINKLKLPLYGAKWDQYDKDRLRFFLAYFALRYSDAHYLETEFFDNPQPYTEILDSIDGYVKDMKERTEEAEFLYFVANMYSADRFENIDPLDKLNELWSEIQGIYLNENITEFKVEYWEEKAQNTYNYMAGRLTPSNQNSYSNSSNGYGYANNPDIFKRVKNIIIDKLSVSGSEIHLNARLKEDLGADSLDAVELIMELEKEFGITIPDEKAERIRTVGHVIDYIRAAIH